MYTCSLFYSKQFLLLLLLFVFFGGGVGHTLQHARSYFPRPGLEPVSPALAGRLSTTAPPGKPLSLSLILVISITICLCVVLFGLIMFGTLCFLDLDVCFFSQVMEVFSYYILIYILCPFFFLLPSGTPIM